jgi:DNA mismatch endonuclease (patch repair protein)
MKAVRRKDTAPELFVRRMLHAAGYRYRLHRKELPGCPDIVFVSKKRAIFVHGCFWHGHDCRAGRPPQSRQEYWVPKIARNRERDVAAVNSLISSGWKIHVVWECELADGADVMNRLKQFIDS